MELLIIILIPVILFGTIGGISFYFIRKSGYMGNDKSRSKSVESVQEFLPFEGIDEDCLIIEGGKYRKIIECSSTNYALKTDEEQVSIEMIFQRFINSLTFPVVFFLQTRVIDNAKRLMLLHEDASVIKRTFPMLEDYADRYMEEMRHVNEFIGNSTQKKRFIIVPFDEAVAIDGLTEEDQAAYIKKELDNRCDIVMSGLASLGVKTHVLDRGEIVELLYSSFYRDDYSYSENLTNEEALSMLVSARENVLHKPPVNKKIASNLLEVMTLIDSGLADKTEEDKEIIEQLQKAYRRYEIKLGGGGYGEEEE